MLESKYINLVDIEAKVLRENAIIPTYAHGTEDSGMDVYAAAIAVNTNNGWVEYPEYTLNPGETVLVKTGVAMSIPKGLEAQARPTSGNSLKYKIRVPNSPGTIDAGFRNEIGIIIENTGTTDFRIANNVKIAQLVICPVYHAQLNIVNEFSQDSDRGMGGFGSTGDAQNGGKQ
jgi:dUTP pyrophosphatase